MKTSHPMIDTLRNLRGNPKACVLTEPLWGIPFNLYAPYASLYMLALGVSESQIGLIASIGMVFQVFSALFSGAITDKMGRKRTTLIFDILSWSVPTLIWAVSQSFAYFLIAAIANSLWRITANSWTCLLVEDCDQKELVNVYSWIQIAGLLSAFFAPAAGLFVGRYGLVPTVRVLYLLAFALMTAKFIILNAFATETRQGEVRRLETQNQSVASLLGQYGGVLRQIVKTPQTLVTLGIMLVMSIATMINGTFWAIIATERILVAERFVALFPFLRSIVMLFFLFFVMPRLSSLHFGRPLIAGFSLFVFSQLLLITAPAGGYVLLVSSTALEACSLALIYPFMDSLVVLSVDPKERARIMSILYVIIITLTSPFGWLAGLASEVDHRLPFLINIGLFCIGAALVYHATRRTEKTPSAAA